jgi:ribosomal protein S18 acetylase RimI-like enzyme
VRIRPARADDAAAIAEVFIPSFESLTFLPMLHTHAEHREFIRSMVMRDEVWVAEENGQIVGMAALADDVLGHLYVHPDFQDRGAGSALFEKAKQLRPRGLTLWVFQQNDRARRFYERRGCRLVRLADGSGNEENTPNALYQWRRPDSPAHPF